MPDSPFISEDIFAGYRILSGQFLYFTTWKHSVSSLWSPCFWWEIIHHLNGFPLYVRRLLSLAHSSGFFWGVGFCFNQKFNYIVFACGFLWFYPILGLLSSLNIDICLARHGEFSVIIPSNIFQLCPLSGLQWHACLIFC